MLEKIENKRKETGNGPFLRSITAQIKKCFYLYFCFVVVFHGHPEWPPGVIVGVHGLLADDDDVVPDLTTVSELVD